MREEEVWSRRGQGVMGLCFVLNMFDGVNIFALTYVAPVLQKVFGVGTTQFSVVFSAGLIGMAIGGLVFAPQADRIGRRPVILCALAIMAGAMILSAYASGIWMLALIRVLVGVGIGTVLASITALSAGFAPDRWRSVAAGVPQAGYPIGATIAGFVIVWALPAYGWRSIFIGAGVLTLLLLPLCYWALPETPETRGHSHSTIAEALGGGRRRNTYLSWLSTIGGFMALYFIASWITKLAIQAGLPSDQAIVASAIYNIGACVGTIALSFAATRLDIRRLMAAMLIAASVLFLVFGGAASGSGRLAGCQLSDRGNVARRRQWQLRLGGACLSGKAAGNGAWLGHGRGPRRRAPGAYDWRLGDGSGTAVGGGVWPILRAAPHYRHGCDGGEVQRISTLNAHRQSEDTTMMPIHVRAWWLACPSAEGPSGALAPDTQGPCSTYQQTEKPISLSQRHDGDLTMSYKHILAMPFAVLALGLSLSSVQAKTAGESLAEQAVVNGKIFSVGDDPYPAHAVTFAGGVTGIPDLTYRIIPGYRPTTLDLYLPPKTFQGTRPTIIFIHGGGWMGGDKRLSGAFDNWTHVLASMAQRGYVVAAVSYRFSAEAPSPAAIQDVKASIRWLRANAATYDIDPARVGAFGGSAGGQLAALAATSCGAAALSSTATGAQRIATVEKQTAGDVSSDRQSDCLQAAVTWYGIFDFTTMPIRDSEKAYLGCGKDACTVDQLKQASAVTYLGDKTPPMLMIAGSVDQLVPPEQSIAFAKAMQHKGLKGDLIIIPDVDHSFIGKTTEATQAASRLALAKTVDFLDAVIGDKK